MWLGSHTQTLGADGAGEILHHAHIHMRQLLEDETQWIQLHPPHLVDRLPIVAANIYNNQAENEQHGRQNTQSDTKSPAIAKLPLRAVTIMTIRRLI